MIVAVLAKLTDPVTLNEPVNWWLSSAVSPNLVLPDTSIWELVIEVLTSLAIIVSETVKEPVKNTLDPACASIWFTFNLLIL